MSSDINSEGSFHKESSKNYFDKEYSLEELFCKKSFDMMIKILNENYNANACIVSKDYLVFYSYPEKTDLSYFINEIKKKEEFDFLKREDKTGRIGFIYSIKQDFEPIGWLVLASPPGSGTEFLPVADLFNISFKRIINLKYQTGITSKLHHEVVEDNFNEILLKNKELEKSNEKYKQLSKNLEIEVKKKTEKIKNTQFKLYQQEKLASVGRLAAGIAHEINNPLAFVKSNFFLIETYYKDLREFSFAVKDLEEKREIPLGFLYEEIDRLLVDNDIAFKISDFEELIEETKEGIERIINTIKSLKDFSAIDDMGKTLVDINKCIENSIDMVKSISDSNIIIDKNFSDLPQMPGDRDKLSQVFLNLILNGVQACENGGSVNISTGYSLDDKPCIEVLVEDSGVGINNEDVKKIFEPFYTTRPVGKGMGLGLAIAYDIINGIDGTIKVESEPGKGSRFYIKLFCD